MNAFCLYSNTNQSIKKQQFIELSKLEEKSFRLRTRSTNSGIVSLFMKSQALYGGNASFYTTLKDSETLMEFSSYGKIIDSMKNIKSENQILSFIRKNNGKLGGVIYQKNDFIVQLGSNSYTFIAMETNVENAKVIYKELRAIKPDIGFIIISDELFKEYCLTPSRYLLFRLVDQEILPYNGEIGEFLELSKPYFQESTLDLLKNTDQLVFSFYIEKISQFHKDLLYSLSKIYHEELQFLILDSDSLSYLYSITRTLPDGNGIQVCLFHPIKRYFYFASFERGIINIADEISHTIKQILNHTIKPKYQSERVSRAVYGTMEKIVGDTYDLFITNNTTSVVLYANSSCNICREFFDRYIVIADKYSSNSRKFGFIDISQNSIEGGFPNGTYPMITVYHNGVSMEHINRNFEERLYFYFTEDL